MEFVYRMRHYIPKLHNIGKSNHFTSSYNFKLMLTFRYPFFLNPNVMSNTIRKQTSTRNVEHLLLVQLNNPSRFFFSPKSKLN